jgi:hypothetical protein
MFVLGSACGTLNDDVAGGACGKLAARHNILSIFTYSTISLRPRTRLISFSLCLRQSWTFIRADYGRGLQYRSILVAIALSTNKETDQRDELAMCLSISATPLEGYATTTRRQHR